MWPDPMDLASGCPFYLRCPERRDICNRLAPELVGLGKGYKMAYLPRYADAAKCEKGIPVDAKSRESRADSAT
ncbi:MAG: hypothetical protein CME16_05105 [Gemmatimonadetes bacterium]|nr:hypothetical protein [Gemmatimonadota bacterium]